MTSMQTNAVWSRCLFVMLPALALTLIGCSEESTSGGTGGGGTGGGGTGGGGSAPAPLYVTGQLVYTPDLSSSTEYAKFTPSLGKDGKFDESKSIELGTDANA